jgi:NADH-quinone oxidoreductase subunit M
LVVMTLLLGVYPALVLDLIGPSVEALVAQYEMAITAAHGSGKLAASQ